MLRVGGQLACRLRVVLLIGGTLVSRIVKELKGYMIKRTWVKSLSFTLTMRSGLSDIVTEMEVFDPDGKEPGGPRR
jgi:hypothetical protein